MFPVNCILDGTAPVFRTDPGTKFSHGPGTSRCASRSTGSTGRGDPGWSVVVTGVLETIDETDGRPWSHVRSLPVHPWGGGEKAHWLRVVPGLITGRRVGPGLGLEEEGGSSWVSASDRRALDVLLVEAQPHAGAMASATLEEAGHRVHRCHGVDEPAFPCTAVTDPG